MRIYFGPVGHDLGLLVQVPGFMALASLPVAAIAGEWFAMPGFLLAAGVSIGLGQILYRRCPREGGESAPQPWVVVAIAWAVIAALGGIPFYITALLGDSANQTLAVFADPINAFFEGMSGFTSTGLSMTADPSVLPYSLQWWRSFSEWIGGVGVVVLALALINPSQDQYALYSAEAREQTFAGNVTQTVRQIWLIYVGYSIVAMIAFTLAGMPLWEALNHGLTGISTGGFSVTADSFQSYDSAVKAVATAVMLLGAVSFNIHCLLLIKRDPRAAARQSQLWTFIVLLLVGLLVLSWVGAVSGAQAGIIDYIFQWVSALATSGFSSVQLSHWPQSTLLVVVCAMFIGGMAGSTSGGLKLDRITWLAKALWWRLADLWTAPYRSLSYRFDGEQLREKSAFRQISQAALMAFLWLLTLTLGTLLLYLCIDGRYSLYQALFEATSALGSVGLSIGISSPEMAPGGKVVLLTLMWMGRLEILAVVVLAVSPFMNAWSRRQHRPAEPGTIAQEHN